MRRLKVWLLQLLVCAGGIPIAYFWLDRPLSVFAHDHTRTFAVFEAITHVPEWLPGICVVIFIAFGMRAVGTDVMPRYGIALTLSSISLIFGRALKDQAKYIFGRTWPETWTHDNASYIHDGVYGFHPFHAGSGFESFPSGHMTAVTAVTFVISHFYPHLRPICMAVAALIAGGLLGANYHFLSDVIAGGFVGLSTATMTVAVAHSLATSIEGKPF